MYKLTIQPPEGEAYTVPLDPLPMKIGRSGRSDLRLEDPFASRVHAELRQVGDGLQVRDLGSGNGTFVKGVRVGTHTAVEPGDGIQIGNSRLVIEERRVPARPSGHAPSLPLQDLVVSTQEVRQRRQPDGTLPMSEVNSVLEAVREAASGPGEVDTPERSKDLFSVVSEIGQSMLAPGTLEESLDQTLDLLFEGVPAHRACLLLREGEDDQLVSKVASSRPGAGMDDQELRISRSIVERVVGRGEPVLTSDAQSDDRFMNQDSIIMSSVRSVMAAPLAVDDRVLGMIYVDSPLVTNVFSEDDLRMVTLLAGLAAIKVDNAVLWAQRMENERMRQQLASAREIQARLLPLAPPKLEGYDVAGVSFSCGEVGGDYYDYLNTESSTPILALGDVSGKGMDAALLMSSLQASLRTEVGSGSRSVELVSRVNRFVHASTPANRFVTLFVGELDMETHLLRYVNAGHNPPLLIRGEEEVIRLGACGMPVGIAAEAPYTEARVELLAGDVLLIYSDGISEANNEAEEELGEEPLIDVVRGHAGATAAELQQRIDAELARFTGSAPQYDDMTLVVLRRL